MIEYVHEIRNALSKECYLPALALSLTLPDICSQVENNVSHGTERQYIDWFNKHVECEDFHFPLPGFAVQTFDGEMCYSLRCKVLHNGNTDIKNPPINVLIDRFELIKPGTSNCAHGYCYRKSHNADGSNRLITCIAIDYLCERLCDMAKKFYDTWPNKQDFDEHKIWSV